MGYKSLGPRTVTAVLNSQPSINPGNWSASMTNADFRVNISFFELHHLVIQNGPPGSSFTWYLNNQFYDVTPNGDINSWDPNQALELTPGDELTFTWNKSTGTAPTVTVFLRYDPLAQIG